MSGVILYTTEDGASRIQLRADGQAVWLTQAEMAELFDVTTENICQHLKNIISDRKLEPERTTEESSVVQREGGREVRRLVAVYNPNSENSRKPVPPMPPTRPSWPRWKTGSRNV
ncbi:hypothetical protein [Luteimonas mephitis]|uniref:hypothetical protein n=1 Tax=Luteimonas mephitis TaxID=83615 RepID=UPI0004291E5B|nr:hypothetical protein [Luteimonas mephitis]